MKIIISPAKKMAIETDHFLAEKKPEFLTETNHILLELKKLSYEEVKKIWRCSDKLAQENYASLQSLDLSRHYSPAIMVYQGLQYQYMAPDLFTEEALAYIKNNVRILSGFYGILRPFDGIVPYRLEMQAALPIKEAHNLYAFWGNKLYEALHFNEGPVINLASKEYSKAITPYLKTTDQLIEVTFASLINGKLKVKATLAKMARGEMVRFMAENQVKNVEEIKQFQHPNYLYSEQFSSAKQLVFLYQN